MKQTPFLDNETALPPLVNAPAYPMRPGMLAKPIEGEY